MTVVPIPEAVQKTLASRLLYTGAIDGWLGPLGFRGLMAVAAGRKSLLDISMEQATGLWLGFVEAGVTTRIRICHALAQLAVETASFQSMAEYGGPTYFARYDGKLGNGAGDGYRYRGRGYIQLTGRDNYAKYGSKVGVDLLTDPGKASDPYVAGAIFRHYWIDHRMNARADADDLVAVTRALNGGTNGIEARGQALNRVKAIWPAEQSQPRSQAA